MSLKEWIQHQFETPPDPAPPKHGKVVLLGRPIPITDAIERMLTGAADHAARKRIFSDDYSPPDKEN